MSTALSLYILIGQQVEPLEVCCNSLRLYINLTTCLVHLDAADQKPNRFQTTARLTHSNSTLCVEFLGYGIEDKEGGVELRLSSSGTAMRLEIPNISDLFHNENTPSCLAVGATICVAINLLQAAS